MIYIPFDYVIYTTIIVTLIHLSSTIFIKAIEDHALNKDFDVILNNARINYLAGEADGIMLLTLVTI